MVKKVILIFITLLFILLMILFKTISRNQDENELSESKFTHNTFKDEVVLELIMDQYKEDTLYLKFLLRNNSLHEIQYGDYYVIEKLNRNKWYTIYELEYWNDIAYTLEKGSENEVMLSIPNSFMIEEGTYRIIKEITFLQDAFPENSFIASEFVLTD